MRYRVRIEQDENGIFVAECPALPGCISEGQTRAEALANIKDAIEGYLESLRKHDDPIPPPIQEETVPEPQAPSIPHFEFLTPCSAYLPRDSLSLIFHPSFGIPHPALPNPHSPIRNLQSAISNPQSPIPNPQSSIPNRQSPIVNPQSAIVNPPLASPKRVCNSSHRNNGAIPAENRMFP